MARAMGVRADSPNLPATDHNGVRASGPLPPTKTVRNAPGTMARTIHCLHCGVSLTLPDQAEGRRVRCPKCGGRFQVAGLRDAPAPPLPGSTEPNPNSTFELKQL